MRNKAHKIDAAFAQERSVLVKKVIELQVARVLRARMQRLTPWPGAS